MNKLHHYCTTEHHTIPEKNMLNIYMLLLKDLQHKLNEKGKFQKFKQCMLVCVCFSGNVDTLTQMYTQRPAPKTYIKRFFFLEGYTEI